MENDETLPVRALLLMKADHIYKAFFIFEFGSF